MKIKNITKKILIPTLLIFGMLNIGTTNAGGYGLSSEKEKHVKEVLNMYFAKYEKEYSKEKAIIIFTKVKEKVSKLEKERKKDIEIK
jgi:hypothetical protein